MKIGTKHIVGAVILLLFLGQGENVRKSIAKEEVRKSARTEKQDKLREEKDRIKDATELSKVALSRANNCIEIIDIKSLKPVELSSKTTVSDSSQKSKLREGAIVCSGKDTGVVDKEGFVTDIARVSVSDLEVYNNKKQGK